MKIMLAKFRSRHYVQFHEQAHFRQTRSNSGHVVRGVVDAVDLAVRGRVDKHGYEAVD